MKLRPPSRSPRTTPSHWTFAGFPVRDFENVAQANGLFAHYVSDTSLEDKGWRFDCWIDKQGFVILEGPDQTGKFAQLLLDSTPEKRDEREKQRREEQEEVRIARRAAGEADTPLMDFSNFVMPSIRGMMDAPLLQELVAVQPMKVPSASPAFKLEIISTPLEAPALPTVGPGETLHQYVYGGVLSERGGYFVTHQDTPGRVLRYRQTWMS